jgi:hypothetical protein
MRYLDQDTKAAVQQVIDEHLTELQATPGFVDAEPGFPIIDGRVHKEPAIILFVAEKKPPSDILAEDRAPRQLGPYRVSVMQADPERQVMASAPLASVATAMKVSGTGLTYQKMPGNPINRSFQVSTRMLCHVGPDAGWPVLKPFLEATEKTLSVAMYDFNADYIAKSFIDIVRGNKLKVVLTWDDGMTPPETKIRGQLKTRLKTALDGWLVRSGGGRRFASAYHEKVAVRDSKAFWLSSGNWSLRSQPNIDPVGDRPSPRGCIPRATASGMSSSTTSRWPSCSKNTSPTIATGPRRKSSRAAMPPCPSPTTNGCPTSSSRSTNSSPRLSSPSSSQSRRKRFRPRRSKVEVQPVLTPDKLSRTHHRAVRQGQAFDLPAVRLHHLQRPAG